MVRLESDRIKALEKALDLVMRGHTGGGRIENCPLCKPLICSFYDRCENNYCLEFFGYYRKTYGEYWGGVIEHLQAELEEVRNNG